MEAAEVVQLFVAPSPALLQAPFSNNLPRKALKSFARVVVQPGQHQVVELSLSSKDFQYATSGATPAVFPHDIAMSIMTLMATAHSRSMSLWC